LKNLFIGHSYHKKTQSSQWFIEFLKKHSTVLDLAWDDRWTGGAPVSIDNALNGNYDHIFVWQVEMPAFDLARKVPERLVFVPMYDSCFGLPDWEWDVLKRSRILNFSWDLHTRAQRLGLRSLHAQYFPNPDQFEPLKDFSDLRGFFWFRRKELSWDIIKPLAAGSHWARFFFHNALDPVPDETAGPYTDMVPVDDLKEFNIAISQWLEDKSHIEEIMRKANVFFASRWREGIGMSVLEAMARGQCIVAPNFPTHSEYLTHNVSGLLYDVNLPEPLDLSRAATLGAAARRLIERGYRRWVIDLENRLPEFLFNERSEIAYWGPDYGTWTRNKSHRGVRSEISL
jgi:hypothetical protein